MSMYISALSCFLDFWIAEIVAKFFILFSDCMWTWKTHKKIHMQSDHVMMS